MYLTPEEASVLACVGDSQEWSQRRDKPVITAQIVNAFVERSEAPSWPYGYGRAHAALEDDAVRKILRGLREKWLIEYDETAGTAWLSTDGRNHLFGL